MDFSENLSGTPKFEPQSDHFSKQQLSLHSTVKYDCNIETDEPSCSYYYHLPNDSTHDAVFARTFAQVVYILGHPAQNDGSRQRENALIQEIKGYKIRIFTT